MSSKLETLAFTFWRYPKEPTEGSEDVMAQPAFSLFSHCIHIRSLKLKLCVDVHIAQEDFHWLCTSVANCPSTLRRVEIKLQLWGRTEVGPGHAFFTLEWCLLERALSVGSVEDVVVRVDIGRPPPRTSADLVRIYRPMRAYLVLRLPRLWSYGRLRFSGECEEQFSLEEQESAET
ncbi:hypothetical protein EIP91_000358 [Steccherinum ochraceum]|uniref:Uncharacterized protein n=1 Tax=Steccherinum ochraceum TaxID=92696 RepID=A0A4R0RPH0_9APHY|nr:hypothetical protein EIP91_000358 [Steccherinum ochraceum]